MPVAPSFVDLLTQGQSEAQFRRPDMLFADGDMSLAQLHAAAAMADAVVRFGVQALKETFIDGAAGDALDLLLDDHFNLQRSQATAAQVTVRFTRTSGGGSGSIGAGTVVATVVDASGKEVQFTTNSAVAVGAGNNGPFDVLATAINTGRDGNVAAGKVTRIVTTLFDSTFSVTNPATAGGGNEKESDESYRERGRTFWTTLRRGTLAALEFGAKIVPTVRAAAAVENQTTALVTVIISDQDGNSTAQMVDDVIAELENWRCAGVSITVTGGTKVAIDMTITITVRSGFNVEAMRTLLETAAKARIDKLAAQQTLYLDSVIAAIISVAPDQIYDVEFEQIIVGGVSQSTPQDVVPSAVGQVLRAGTVTIGGA